jgi:hypothetical protein
MPGCPNTRSVTGNSGWLKWLEVNLVVQILERCAELFTVQKSNFLNFGEPWSECITPWWHLSHFCDFVWNHYRWSQNHKNTLLSKMGSGVDLSWLKLTWTYKSSQVKSNLLLSQLPKSRLNLASHSNTIPLCLRHMVELKLASVYCVIYMVSVVYLNCVYSKRCRALYMASCALGCKMESLCNVWAVAQMIWCVSEWKDSKEREQD